MSGSAAESGSGPAAGDVVRGDKIVVGGHDNIGRLDADAVLGAPHTIHLDGSIANLPKVPARVFVGRDEALAALDAVAVGGSVAVTQAVAGLGGVGKTEVVLQYCHRHRDRHQIIWWLTADSPDTIEAGLAELAAVVAARVGKIGPRAAVDAARWAIGFLAARPGWLLVLDNVEDPRHAQPLLAQLSGGRVLVTSRRDVEVWRQFVDVAVSLDVLDPPAAVRLLAGRTGDDDEVTAARLAAELGFLPLALTAATAYLAQTRTSTVDYLTRLRRQPATVLSTGAAMAEQTVGRVWDITLVTIGAANPLAIDVLRVLAMLAADDVPRYLLAPLSDEPGAVELALGLLASYNMITLTSDTVSTHRLVQTVVASQAENAGVGAAARRTARRLITQARPERDPAKVFGDWRRWAALVPQIQALAERWPHDDPHTDLAVLLVGVGLYQSAQGLNIAKIEADSQALAIYETAHGSSHPDTLSIRNYLASDYQAVGRYAEAVALHEQTLADRTSLLGSKHPHTQASRNNLANGYREVGRYDEAIVLDEQILTDCTDTLGPVHPDTLASRSNLAFGYRAVGRYAEAVTLDEQTLADRTGVLGPDHLDTIASRNNLALGYRAVGRYAEAVTLDEQTLADRTRVLGPDHPDTLNSRNNLANDYQAMGRLDAAVDLYEQNLADRIRILGPEHPRTQASRNDLANARQRMSS